MTSGVPPLLEVLERARAAGALGPGPLEVHIRHSDGFAEAAEAALGRPPVLFADLGTGGGVPGLALGLRWTAARGFLVDSNQRRSAALRDAVAELGLDDRVEVVEGRAEAFGRGDLYRERFEVVTARSFAEPAVTAEIAAGFVAVGGMLVVSEPPDPPPDRWPPERLAELGFEPAIPMERRQAHFIVSRKASATPERFPRAVGRPGKRPLW